MKPWRLFPRATGFGLTLAVLAVSLCAARCAAPAVGMPCHDGGAGDEGPCAAFSSQTWIASPDLTAAILAFLLILALAILLVPAFSAQLSFSLPALVPFEAEAPPARQHVRITPVRGPPRRR